MTQPAWHAALYIDGAFVPSSDGGTIDVTEKATGQSLGVAGLAARVDVDRAATGAATAQPAWARTPYDVRAGVLRTAAALLQQRSTKIADWIVRETGSIRGKAEYEIAAAQNELHEAAGLTSRATAEILPSHDPQRVNLVERIPVGVVGVITPWNFPLVLAMRAVAPALALGNSVMLKPAELTPVSGGYLIAQLFAEAGLPAGVLQVVPGLGEIAGEALVEQPRVDMVHFTGSTEVGRHVAEVGGRTLRKVSLELGGNNAFVVLDDVDVDTASMIGAWSSFHYQGQTCITASRHIVLREVADEYVAALAARAKAIQLGDPMQDGIGLGPLISAEQRDRVRRIVDESVRQGAKALVGGTHDGLFYAPTVLVDVTPDMPAYTEEVFGPVAPVLVVDDEAAALAAVNDVASGLVNAVCSGDPRRGLAFASQCRSGMVHVNDATCLDEAHVPFGGMGDSGAGGRSGGEGNLDEFTQRRWISVQRGAVQYPY